MRTKNRLILFFFMFIVLWALTSPSGPAMAEEEKFIKWGAIEPLSGSAALWGKAMNQGVELAADEFNAKGGLKVENIRYKIKILEEIKTIPLADKIQRNGIVPSV